MSLVHKKNLFSFPVAVNTSVTVGPFLVINACNHYGSDFYNLITL
jgi:hypothetical protein